MNEIEIKQIECNKFRITLNVDSDDARLYVRKYNEDDFQLTPTHTFIALSEDYDTTSFDDGVYICKIDDVANGEIYYFPLYVYCSIQNCINAFNKKLICESECEPCSDCDDIGNVDYQKMMYEYNKLSTFFFMILGYINWEKVQYFNMFDWTDSRALITNKIGSIIDKTYTISGRCSACNDEEGL